MSLDLAARPVAPPVSPHYPSHPAPYVQVILERSGSGFDAELTYSWPLDWKEAPRVGQAVAVPLRFGRVVGYVVGLSHELHEVNPRDIRPVESLLAPAPLFDELALKIARWMAAYYHCPVAECLALFIPAGATPELEAKWSFVADEPLRTLRDLARTPKLFAIAEILWKAKKPLSTREISKHLEGTPAETDQLRRLCEIGVVAAVTTSKSAVKVKFVPAVRLTEEGRALLETGNIAALEKKAPKQALALRVVAQMGRDWISSSSLLREAGVEIAPLKSLAHKGALELGQIEAWRTPDVRSRKPKERVALTAEQQNAVSRISASLDDPSDLQTVLLHGVTASGKTEVYLAAIEHCLQKGRRALVLVPEIALTAQTVEIFQGRFGSQVAILHSALGAGERFDEWRRAGSGEAQIVVGARSAVFAPVRDLGLLIIDEEHDGSYKQDKTPRYHAREVALKRCALEGAVLVLGSATPSLESYARAQRDEYAYVEMKNRATGRPLPSVEIVDMTSEAKAGVLPVLSTRLKDELCETVARGEQAILFLNRRGYATYVQCLGCGHVERCPNCDVSLTHHKAEGTLRCHHCDHCVKVPGRCPQCDGWMLGFSGSGTEKVANEVEELWKERSLGAINILRLDRDTTMNKGAHAQILGDFRAGRASVLIGTQMVTKGLDFPRVTLVGVISADTALNVPDFRAAERTFQLLSQVAGRAGRGQIPGRVLIQSLAASDIAITTAAAHDFNQFVDQELAARSVIPNPPFSHAVNIISSHTDEAMARLKLDRLAGRLMDAIAKEGGGTDLLGPVSCPLARVKSKFRFHLLLRDRSRPRLHRVLSVYDGLSKEDKEGLTVDVDALSIL